ncbi:MAG: type II secretion system protein N [Halopseudomonas yangmingensis]|uniref:General secretion pathway protein C n=1 Tax=Halopseudomonas yangmingensis TaxID=1720063 RepID=A0A1I4U6M3_9GAMM|nr:type II secretion system protein N [Halopseudomonas yangmingensis]SFM84555.1 general secretion pathway protein C [Halopseudomonas yangmingensis]
MPQAAVFSSRAWVNLGLLAGLLLAGLLLARITWMFLYPQSLISAGAAGDHPEFVAATTSANAPGFAELARLSVFGAAAQAVPSLREAPDTQLNWTLRGVLANPDPARSAALLAVQGQPERAWRVGARLPGNVTLEEIHPDRVILSRGGSLETLRLPRAELRGAESAPRRAQRLPALPPVEASADLSLAEDGGVARIDRDAWLAEPSRFLEVVSATPVLVDGRMRGLEVRPSRNAREFAAAGLQAGDVVTAVEGRPVADINDYRDLLQDLSGVGSVSLAVERNGEPITITISMD